MQKRRILIVVAAAAGLAAGLLAERWISSASAGGVSEAGLRATYVTASQAGDTLYYWSVGPNPHVVQYRFEDGSATARDLKPGDAAAPGKGAKGAAEPDPDAGPEIVISGVFWTPNSETRVAIINGKSVREGEIFETRSGKKYKVVEIKRTEDVDYVEVK